MKTLSTLEVMLKWGGESIIYAKVSQSYSLSKLYILIPV